jgi:hypothetical protein
MPNDPMMHLDPRPFKWGQHGRVKGVDADWPRHSDIWETDENEPSMLGARNGVPDPPRRVSQYHGWRPVECEELWCQGGDIYRIVPSGEPELESQRLYWQFGRREDLLCWTCCRVGERSNYRDGH